MTACSHIINLTLQLPDNDLVYICDPNFNNQISKLCHVLLVLVASNIYVFRVITVFCLCYLCTVNLITVDEFIIQKSLPNGNY